MKTICEQVPYTGFKKLLSFLTAFAFHDHCEHVRYRDYILKAMESKYSRDFSAGKLGRWLPRGEEKPTRGKSLNSLEIQKIRIVFAQKF